MEHMLQSHCLQWRCVYCAHDPFSTTSSLRDHLCDQHGSVVSTSEIETTIGFCELPKPFDIATKCPLCCDSLESVEIYRCHVGRHLEDIALFILPYNGIEYLDDQNSTVSNIGTGENDYYVERREMKKGGSSKESSVIRGHTENARGGGHFQPDRLIDDSDDGSQQEIYRLNDNGGIDSTMTTGLQVEDPKELQDAKSPSPQDRIIHPSRAVIAPTIDPTVLSQQGSYSQNSNAANPRLETDLSTLSLTSDIPGEFAARKTTQAGLTSRKETDTDDWLTRDYFAPAKSGKEMAPQQDAKRVGGESFDAETRAEAGPEKAESLTVAKLVEAHYPPAEKQAAEGRVRTVRFGDDSLFRKSNRSRDSALGSSIAHTYGEGSDRYSSAQNYDNQRFSIGALQEALGSTREEKRGYKFKEPDLNAQLAACQAALRQKELEVRALKTDNINLRHSRDTFEIEVHDLRRRLRLGNAFDRSVTSDTTSDYISGGSGESSSSLNRSRSKRHESQEAKDRLLQRINAVNPITDQRDNTRRRRGSVSQPRTPFTREALIDDRTRRGPPMTTRGFDRFERMYLTSPTIRFDAISVPSARSATSSADIFASAGRSATSSADTFASTARSATSSVNTVDTAISDDYVPDPFLRRFRATQDLNRIDNIETIRAPTKGTGEGRVSPPRSATSFVDNFYSSISSDYVPMPLPPKPKGEGDSASSRKHQDH